MGCLKGQQEYRCELHTPLLNINPVVLEGKRDKCGKLANALLSCTITLYSINILTLLAYLDIILCAKVVGKILQIEWMEPFKEGMIQTKSDVGFTSNGSSQLPYKLKNTLVTAQNFTFGQDCYASYCMIISQFWLLEFIGLGPILPFM